MLGGRAGRYPAVVVEDEHRVLGFGWSSEYRAREAYAGRAEFSIYVARDARGRGVGRLCLEALITEAERHGFWKLLSRIFPENAASRRLCVALGFRPGVARREWRGTCHTSV